MPNFNPKGSQYCYGNYDKYYGYRNSGAFEEDVRLSLLKKEWFEGKDCLDIGSNTGQVCVCVCVCACMGACVGACVRMCVHMCLSVPGFLLGMYVFAL